MAIALRRAMTLAECLDWEEGQALPCESDGFQPVAMTEGIAAHSLLQTNLKTSLQTNLIGALSGRLRGSPFRVHGSHLKIKVAGSIRYPDAFVCSPPVAANRTVMRDSIVVFEMFSLSTATTDCITRNRECGAIPSIHRYVMLEQDRIGGQRVGQLVTGEETLHLPEIGLELPLSELYEGMDLPENPDAVTLET